MGLYFPAFRRDRSAFLTALPAVLVTLIACVCPLSWVLITLLTHPTVRHEIVPTHFRMALLSRTLGYNGLAALIAAAMGLPAGIVLGRGRGWIARILWVLLPAALLLPSLSYAYGWAQLMRIVRPWLMPLGITFVPGGVADTLRCIWSLAAWLWAVPAALIGVSLRRMSTNVQQQALLDGALRRITLRQLLAPIVASMAIVTILATQEFAVYEPTGISVVATEMRMVFDTGSTSSELNPITITGYLGNGLNSPDQPARAAAAVATALPLIAITVGLAILAAIIVRRDAAVEAIGVDDWPKVLEPSWWTIAISLTLVLCNLVVPTAALFASLHVRFSPARIFEEFWPQVSGTLLVAGFVSVVALAAALSAAGQWTRGLLVLGGATFLIGGQLLAIGLIRLYNRPGLAWAYDCAVLPIIAYLGRYGWIAFVAGRSAWSGPWRELRDIAKTDGATAWQSAYAIVWPLAWPTLLAGGLMVAALSLTEVPATVLMMPQNPQVLTPTLMTWLHMARYDSMIEASLLMMMMVIGPAIAAIILGGVGLQLVRGSTAAQQSK